MTPVRMAKKIVPLRIGFMDLTAYSAVSTFRNGDAKGHFPDHAENHGASADRDDVAKCRGKLRAHNALDVGDEFVDASTYPGNGEECWQAPRRSWKAAS